MLKRDLFAGQDDKQGMNHSDWPHAKQHWEPKATNGKEIDHRVDPKGLRQSHLSEDAQRGNDRAMMIRKMSPQVIRGARGCPCLAITT